MENADPNDQAVPDAIKFTSADRLRVVMHEICDLYAEARHLLGELLLVGGNSS
jgi:hypothetical protein